MGSSTGNMLVDNVKSLEAIFAESPTIITTHCEDEQIIQANLAMYKAKYGDDIPISCHPLIRNEEACFRSSSLAVELATRYGSSLHILHLSTAKELSLLGTASPNKKITGEICVHHLWFDERDYATYGWRIKWNPAIKSQHDKESLLKGLLEGKIDVIATDHAPHTLEEKSNSYLKCPSGGPLVQHSLIAMLEMAKENKISIEQVVSKMCHTPAELFKVKDRGYIREGYKADLVLVDLKAPWTVSSENIYYKCGWSPFEGTTFSSKVITTFVNGNIVYDNGQFNEPSGQRLEFNR
jgi:dihydroorotase